MKIYKEITTRKPNCAKGIDSPYYKSCHIFKSIKTTDVTLPLWDQISV